MPSEIPAKFAQIWGTSKPAQLTGMQSYEIMFMALAHDFKYRLYFGQDGRRLVGYDNERGKGDHRHVRGRELVYRFRSPEELIADFLKDVDDARRG